MLLKIELNPEEKALVKSYANLHSITVSEAFKSALFEKIEDEYDAAVADEAYEEYEREGKESRPIEELWAELE